MVWYPAVVSSCTASCELVSYGCRRKACMLVCTIMHGQACCLYKTQRRSIDLGHTPAATADPPLPCSGCMHAMGSALTSPISCVRDGSLPHAGRQVYWILGWPITGISCDLDVAFVGIQILTLLGMGCHMCAMPSAIELYCASCDFMRHLVMCHDWCHVRMHAAWASTHHHVWFYNRRGTMHTHLMSAQHDAGFGLDLS